MGSSIVWDADALAFISAASITDATQKSAINTLVTSLKNNNIWSKMKAIYPFVGGTASQHRFNLKDPRALDAAYYLTFGGGVTHSSNGILFNGTTGYADTKLNLRNNTSLFNVHFSIYVRTNTNVGIDIGVTSQQTDFINEGWMSSRYNGYAQGGFYDNDAGYAGGGIKVANSDSKGMYVSSALANNNQFLRKNTSALGTWTSSSIYSIPANTTIYLGAVHFENTNLPIEFSNKEFAFSTIGDGLTIAESDILYSSVQAYQTTLSRNI